MECDHRRARITRRALIGGAATIAVGGICSRLSRHNSRTILQAPAKRPEPTASRDLDIANDNYFRGAFGPARAAYLKLGSTGRISGDDTARSAALCSLRLKNAAEACRYQLRVAVPSTDDWRFLSIAYARAGHLDDAIEAFYRLPQSDCGFDIELFEELANRAAETGDTREAWRFYRSIEQTYPSGSADRRTLDKGSSNFTKDFFGYGRESLLNYARGVKNGTVDWGLDTGTGLWHLVRHPVNSVQSFANGVAEIFSKENLKLLLSPTVLGQKLGEATARVYWSAWQSCKESAAREYSLDLDEYSHQQKIHEVAAGRLVGYVAPDLVLLVLSGGAGATAKTSDATKILDVATATARAEEGIEKANLIGRSAQFLEDAKSLPALRRIPWIEEQTWDQIKVCRGLEGRLSQIVGWISDIRDVPNAQRFVKCMASRLSLPDEGYLFQLERAAQYARKNKLAWIGKQFSVDVALPGRPVRAMMGDADLVLTDDTLVEIKFRSSPLGLEEKLHTQLLKYDRAVADGQFKRIRLECNNIVTGAVRDRCSMLRSPTEIAEKIVVEGRYGSLTKQ